MPPDEDRRDGAPLHRHPGFCEFCVLAQLDCLRAKCPLDQPDGLPRLTGAQTRWPNVIMTHSRSVVRPPLGATPWLHLAPPSPAGLFLYFGITPVRRVGREEPPAFTSAEARRPF